MAEGVAEDRVDHKRRQLARDDGNFVAARDRPADLKRGKLREVDGHNGGCTADGKAKHDASHNEQREVWRRDNDNRAEEEQDGEDDDRAAAADGIGNATAEEGAKRRCEDERARDDALRERVEANLGGHGAQRAVDDARVVTEEQPAEARDDRDEPESLAVRAWGEFGQCRL